MAQTLTATFQTRREAELAVEHIVQAHDIDRTQVIIGPEGARNTAGEERSGADGGDAELSPEPGGDAALNGPIAVSVQVKDAVQAEAVRDAFEEAGGTPR